MRNETLVGDWGVTSDEDAAASLVDECEFWAEVLALTDQEVRALSNVRRANQRMPLHRWLSAVLTSLECWHGQRDYLARGKLLLDDVEWSAPGVISVPFDLARQRILGDTKDPNWRGIIVSTFRMLADLASGQLGNTALSGVVEPEEALDETLGQWMRAHREMVDAVELWRSWTTANTDEAFVELVAVVQPHLNGAVRMVLAGESGDSELPPGVTIVPRNLEALMWVQLAQAAAGEGDFRKCEECPNWFVVTHDNRSRTSRKYCSSTCRVNAYRKQAHQAEGADER